MGDVAQILGVGSGKDSSELNPPRAIQMQSLPREVTKLVGITGRDGDVNAIELPPVVPTNTSATATSAEGKTVKIGNKWISSNKPARPWIWAPFSSSSRTDGLLLHHWVRANVEYPDYPYARFDIHLDPVTYNTDEEYKALLYDPDWSKTETDHLLDFAKRYELRWAVIYDRWCEYFEYGDYGKSELGTPKRRKIEDLQHRYYAVAAVLMQARITHEATLEAQALTTQQAASNNNNNKTALSSEGGTGEQQQESNNNKRAADALLIETAAARSLASADPKHQPYIRNIGSGISNKPPFDLNYERERRTHMEAIWNRTKEEEDEEAELRKELKQIEAQLRKLKKSGAHILAAATATTSNTTAQSSRNPSRTATPIPAMMMTDPTAIPNLLDKAFASTAPTPVPGTPYLQSGRLTSPATGGSTGINKTLKTRMIELLSEMNVPIENNLIPTKRVCDLYDTVRRDILTLLVLQKNVLQKEGILQGKQLALAKKSGNTRVMDEETLLGIAPPAPAPAPPVTQPPKSTTTSAEAKPRGSMKGSKGGGSGQGGGGGGGSGKTKGTGKAKTTSTTTTGGSELATDPASKATTPSSNVSTTASGTVKSTTVPGGKQSKMGGGSGKRKRKSMETSGKAAATAAAAAATASNVGSTTGPVVSSSSNVTTTTTSATVAAAPATGGTSTIGEGTVVVPTNNAEGNTVAAPTNETTTTTVTVRPVAASKSVGKKRAKKTTGT